MYNSVYTINADISSVDSPHKLTFYKREHRYQSVMIVCSSELGSVNFSDSYAVVAGIKPDNTNIYDPCIIFGNCIQFSLTEQMTAVAGTYLLDVLIKKDGDDTYRDVACQLEFVIQNGSFDDDITSSSEYQAVTDIESAAMANVKQWVIDNSGGATDSAAEIYKVTFTYGTDRETLTCDKTASDIVSASEKFVVIGKIMNNDGTVWVEGLFLSGANMDDGVFFSRVDVVFPGEPIMYITFIEVSPNNEIYCTYNTFPAASIIALINSPELTGTPTAPTPEITDNSTRIATTAYVNALIDSIMSSPPTE